MNKMENTENQTKKLYLKSIVDVGFIALISFIVLYFYEMYWLTVHTTKENMLAIHFDMFSTVYSLVALLFMFVLPNVFEFFSSRVIMHRYTSENRFLLKLFVF